VDEGPPTPAPEDAALVAAALRVYRRYQREIVEGLHLCPWAARARQEGQVREEVILGRTPDVADAAAAATRVADASEIEIGLLIFPRVRLARAEFERFVGEVREEHTRREQARMAPNRRHGGGRLAMAAFHPDAAPELSKASRLVPFLRRTPDPTIQLVRLSALDRVRANDPAHGTGVVDLRTLDLAAFLATPPQPPIHERIAAHNLDTVQSLGVEAVEALLADIRRDRDATYAALGEPVSAG